jgi:DNA-directed RNA polymerase subunit beta'
VAEPSQDIVLGCYFATKAPAGFDALLKDEKGQQKLRSFGSSAEVEMALAAHQIMVQTPVRYLGRTVEGPPEPSTPAAAP